MGGQFDHKRRYHCVSSSYRNRLDGVCREKAIDAELAEAIVWNSITAKFENLTAFRDELELAQAKELTALDPKREELKTIETWIAEAELEADEIGMALRRARGRVLDGLEIQQNQVNARLDELQDRRKKLIEALGARSLTDDAIGNLTQYAEDCRTGVKNATHEEKRATLRALQVRAIVKNGQVVSVKGVIAFRSL